MRKWLLMSTSFLAIAATLITISLVGSLFKADLTTKAVSYTIVPTKIEAADEVYRFTPGFGFNAFGVIADGTKVSYSLAADGPWEVVNPEAAEEGGIVVAYGDELWLKTDGTSAQVTLIDSKPQAKGGLQAAGSLITRAQWGADESYRLTSNGQVKWPTAIVSPKMIVVHHTVTANNDPNPAATVRAIYYYHAIVLGWGDIGYNYLVDQQGRIYEGRYGGDGVIGGHALKFNPVSIGIGVLGTYTTEVAPWPQAEATAQLIQEKALRWGIDRQGTVWAVNGTYPTIVAHGDVGATACPGNGLRHHMWTFRNYNPVAREYWQINSEGEAELVQKLTDGRYITVERKTAKETALWLWYDVLGY